MTTTMTTPDVPKNAFRVVLELTGPKRRLDTVLIDLLRKQDEQIELKKISRIAFKELFKKRRIHIKGQPAVPSSSLASGTTFVDILGFGATPTGV